MACSAGVMGDLYFSFSADRARRRVCPPITVDQRNATAGIYKFSRPVTRKEGPSSSVVVLSRTSNWRRRWPSLDRSAPVWPAPRPGSAGDHLREDADRLADAAREIANAAARPIACWPCR